MIRLGTVGIFVLLTMSDQHLAAACRCTEVPSPCHSVAAGSMVFIGTVESITPPVLDRWNLDRSRLESGIIDSDNRARTGESSAALAELKAKIRQESPQMSPDLALRLTQAASHDAVIAVFNDIVGRGRQVRFRIDTLFADGEDDDSDKDSDKNSDKDDDDNAPKFLDVATPFGDCGYDFQRGESYLVYADRDEDTEVIETGACSGTKRLSDAGRDLPFLYFHKANKKASGHLEGFATYRSRPHSGDSDAREKPSLPVPNAVVAIHSGDFIRYAVSNSLGQFVFDGLTPGEYTMDIWSSAYPDVVRRLAGPERFEVRSKGCINRSIMVAAP